MEKKIKQLIEILNNTPKENLNLAMKIHRRYGETFDDWLYTSDKNGKKIFLVWKILKWSLPEISKDINEDYFKSLEKFFNDNYLNDKNNFIFKIDLFLQMLKTKTKKDYSINDGDKIFKAWEYNNIFWLESNITLEIDKNKEEFTFDIINLFLSTYIKNTCYIRAYIIYTILIILEKNNYNPNLEESFIFSAINEDLKENLISK